MNVASLNLISNETDRKRLESRLRALATNVIQEARVSHGRGALPFTDDDAQRLDAIFSLLHLPAAEMIDPEIEHFPLVAKEQPKNDPRLDRIGEILENELEAALNPVVAETFTITAEPIKKAVKG
jgi:hypothetical protein